MNRNFQKRVGDKLAKRPMCYVLITCEQPTADGDMQVEMTYEGDAALASYLIQGAQIAMDKEGIDVRSNPRKILSIGG